MEVLQILPDDIGMVAALIERVRVKWPKYLPAMDVEWSQKLAAHATANQHENYAKFIEKDGRCVAAIWVAQDCNVFGENSRSASLMAFLSEDAKAGLTLLKGFLTWADSYAFEHITVVQESGYKTDKFHKVLTRYGFSEHGTVLQRSI